ncbi:MAG: DUF2905 domain-containing protein [Thermodesulfobacteriota bacterium]
MELQGLGKLIIIAGIFLVVIGLLLTLAPKVPFIGKLPGDFYFKRGNASFYFPLASSILISIILSLVLNFIMRKK